MELSVAFDGLHHRDLWLVIIGCAALAAALLPKVLSRSPLSVPMVLIALGAISNPLGLEAADPRSHGRMAEHLTELTVIISLMGAGLKIDRPLGFRSWSTTWRLLSITMLLSIGMVAILGVTLAAFVPATALLLGACIAPTDPVLASDVQVGPPGMSTAEDEHAEQNENKSKAKEDEIRFSLTSEAGLNDGLAFPFTNLAIGLAIIGAAGSSWIGTWFLVDVLYQILAGVIIGVVIGRVMAHLIMLADARSEFAQAMVGLASLAATLILYGAAEFAGGYGFIAVFIGALMIRGYERDHHYHKSLHQFSELAERFLTALVLVLFGAAIMSGLFKPLTWELALTAVIIVLIVRPLAGATALIGSNSIPWRERWAIGFLGIRGIGSFYYLAYALNHADFEGENQLWAVVGLVVLISLVVHGVTAKPIIQRLDELRRRKAKSPA
jgi:NhaP-type Na+/H+ or K+/H+ antiporter